MEKDESVSALCKDFWEWRIRNSPEFASFSGDKRYSELLDEIDSASFYRLENDVRAFLARAEQIDTNGLSKGAALNLLLLKDQLTTFLNGMPHQGWYFPINFMEGLHADIPKVINFSSTGSSEELRKYNKRIACYAKKVKQCIEILSEGIQKGYTCHQYSIEAVPGQLEQLITSEITPEHNVFLGPYKNVPLEVADEGTKNELLDELKEILKTSVLPTMKELKEFIENTYMKSLRPNISHASLPNGEALYQCCLDFHLSTSMTPKQVFDLGIQEVDRITKAMHRITQEEGFGTDIKAFKDDLHNRDEFYCKSPEELMTYVKHICRDLIRPKLSRLFKNFSSADLIIEPMTPLMGDGPNAFYFNGTADGSRPGVYYIKTSNLRGCPKYEMMSLSLHEGEPGHHLQGMYAVEMKDVPMFRNCVEDLNYARVPSRFPLNTAYMEGWGLYSEYLGEELGLYEDNYSLFGRYCNEMLRAVRLVVDPGMHALGWTFDKALDFMKEKTLMDHKSLEAECRRYVTLPGQACAYKVGELKLKELRKKAQEQLGDKFDVRDFHETVLKCGSVPLRVLEKEVAAYIEDSRQRE